MLVPAEWGVLYPKQRGASAAGPALTIVGRAMWEVKRGALGVGHEKSGRWHERHRPKLLLCRLDTLCGKAPKVRRFRYLPPT